MLKRMISQWLMMKGVKRSWLSINVVTLIVAGPRSGVGNLSGYR